ncbi:hypothetical protein J5N97_015043 [Dioscorea zingiberensis]|uniref:Receptor-like serine/threonine-protein kinase n=1 Tax=Dioscorea zingiberensis TaxID=325984 RepID=A0A9D5CV04_9LILI|nr:hypothetical protein J5N97_015043 [Dioscorea zingiberensis]
MKNHHSSALSTIILFLIISLFNPLASPAPQTSLSKESSLSVEEASEVLVSPDGSFTCGFYRVGTNAYALSIWFSNSAAKTISWTANRNQPVNGLGSRVTLQKDGALVLTDVDDTVVWSTNTSSTQADQAQLLNTGNLVIKDPQGNILWQSFDLPTDTLLPTQPITKTKKLVSNMAGGSVSSGYYSFFFDNDNVMKLIYDGPDISSIYWPNPDYKNWENGRYSYNSSRFGVLYENGTFQSSDKLTFSASDMGEGIKRRLTLDYDGNLRLYSLNASTGLWSVTWDAIQNFCDLHGLCGRNGICVYNTQKPMCACPFAYEMSDLSDWTKGCKPKFNISCGDSQQLRFVKLKKTDFWGSDLNYTSSVTFGACRERCEKDCSCVAFVYKMASTECFIKSSLFNGRTNPDFWGSLYLKLPVDVETSDFYVLQVHELNCHATRTAVATSKQEEFISGGTKWGYFYWFLLAFGLIEILFILFGWWFVSKKDKKQPTSIEEGYKLIARQFKRFTYTELKKATGNFKDKLDRGGSRAVYRGVLEDERVVAVEKLDDVIQAEDFWAELSVIAKIYHMNLVRIYGFCSQRSHKFLVSEYAENGTLGKHLFGAHNSADLLGWKESYGVVLLELLMGSRASNWKAEGEKEEETEPELELLGLVRMLKGKLRGSDDSWIDDFVDARLNGLFDHRKATVMVEMAISCLEEDRTNRPTMDSVAQILISLDDEPTYHGQHSS